MSFFKRLFGKAKPPEEEMGIEQHIEYLNSLRLPAVALFPSTGQTLSRIGGLPSLPEVVAWPEWKGIPLAFLCQIDLRELPKDCDCNGLAPSGMLYFFYSQEQETWGFDPKDKGSWSVIHAAGPPFDGTTRGVPQGLKLDHLYASKSVALSTVATYPDWQDERLSALNLTDKQGDSYTELCSSAFRDGPEHHLFGYPSPVQGNDMDLECQLVSHGLYCGNSSGYQDPRAKELEAGRHDWILLFQLDTDDAARMMWGDSGRLYFWIRKQDLKEGRFDKCWMILQCS